MIEAHWSMVALDPVAMETDGDDPDNIVDILIRSRLYCHDDFYFILFHLVLWSLFRFWWKQVRDLDPDPLTGSACVIDADVTAENNLI